MKSVILPNQYFRQWNLMFVLAGILYCTGSLCPILAQQPNLKFKNITIEDGLSHSKVNNIYQDRQGFLWFGTNEGLNKYDGQNFTTFQPDPDDPYSLSANLIRCILEDRQGNLWIGTEAGGLNRFDRRTRKFTNFTRDSTAVIILSGNNVNSIIEDREGILWLGTNRGLDRLELAQQQVTNFRPYPASGANPAMNEIIVLYADRFGILWLGTFRGGLCAFDPATRQFTCFRHNPKNPESIGDDEVHAITEDSQGDLWIGTNGGGLNRFDRASQKFERFFPGPENPESTTIRAILDDGRGNLWVGNRSGLYNFNRTTRQFTYYTHDPNNPYSLVQNSVWSIFKDAKGDLWLGTRGGISYLNTSNLPFVHYRADANNRYCLNKQAVYAILEDRNGDIWFGVEHGGLNHLNRRTGLFDYYMFDRNNPNSPSVNNIKALLEDRSGNIWIGTFNGGLNLFDRKRNRFVVYRKQPHHPASLANDNVMALIEDPTGDLWIATDGGGLDRFDCKIRQFIHVVNAHAHPEFASIHCLLRDRQGHLWIGANKSLLGCLDPRTGALCTYQLNSNMNRVDITHAFEDRNGNLWFGTAGTGLFAFHREKKSFQVYSKKDGLPSNIIYGILEDAAGNLWLSTTNGLCRFDPVSKKTKNFYKENGLQSNQFTYNACLKTRSGEMFFGGINGATAFFPAQIQENAYIPPVVITDFKILNQPVSIGGEHAILTKDISQTAELHLSYKHTVFSFEFVALNYAIPEQNQYAYKMEGFENEWNYVGPRKFATYTNLDPGTYTFRVKATNNDGLWNEQGTSLRITISPPFWKTLWFKLLLIALALLIIKHIYDFLIQKRNLLKARALANLSQLKLLRNQMNPHFLFNALGSIRSMILISQEQAWDMVSELSEFFRYTMLNFNKVEALLDDEINAVHNYLNIEKVRYKDTLQVSFTIADEARQCLLPAFICQPLIENAIKYGMQTSPMPLQVNISISYQAAELTIDVSNTGKLWQPDPSSQNEKDGHGTSLENIKQRLQIMFPDLFSLKLLEEAGWVHVRIFIRCANSPQLKTPGPAAGLKGLL